MCSACFAPNSAFRPFPRRRAHQESVNPILAEYVRKLLVHVADILAAFYLGIRDASSREHSGEPLAHGELGFDLLFVDTPLAHEDRERELIELREGQERVEHVPDARALNEQRRSSSRERCTGADTY